MKSEWLDHHSRAFCCLALASLTLGWTRPDLNTQLQWVALLIFLFGIPHGSLDHLLVSGKTNKILFLVAYASLSLTVVIVWFREPGWSLAAFLGLSVYHFGCDDTLLDGSERNGERLVRGLLPITFPCLFHVPQTKDLFALLSTVDWAAFLVTTLATSGVLALSLWCWLLRACWRQGRAGVALELLLLGFVLAVLPPLMGFCVFFCGLHSARQLLLLAFSLEVTPVRGLAKVLWWGGPITLLTGLVAWALLEFHPGGDIEALTQVVFIGLAALSWPHVVFHSVHQRFYRGPADEELEFARATQP